MIVSDISNPYLMSIAKKVEDTVTKMGYHMVFMSHNHDSERERELLQLIVEQRVEAVVLIPTGQNKDQVQNVMDKNIPVIVVDQKIDGIVSDLIVDDNYYGSFESIAYLHSLGHRKIGIIHGPERNSVGKERLEGALDALEKFQCSQDEKLINLGDFTSEGGYRATTELLLMPNPPTAIYCCNNLMTTGMIKSIRDQRIKVPEDISIIAFGDSSQWELVEPPLTLMTQPLKRIGVEAAILLKNRL